MILYLVFFLLTRSLQLGCKKCSSKHLSCDSCFISVEKQFRTVSVNRPRTITHRGLHRYYLVDISKEQIFYFTILLHNAKIVLCSCYLKYCYFVRIESSYFCYLFTFSSIHWLALICFRLQGTLITCLFYFFEY